MAIVSFPTLEECEANREKLSESEKKGVTARKHFLADFEAASLKSSAELPDLEGDTLIIRRDFVEHNHKRFTVLRHGEKEIWKEPALWEGGTRFEEVTRILTARYGSRLADVVPMPASKMYLYGDLHSTKLVERIRTSFKGAPPEQQA